MDSRKPLEKYRDDFPSLQRMRNGKFPIYMDNACTSLVPRQVIESINEYYTQYPACGGSRSRHWFAREVTHRIEGNSEESTKGSRRIIADFINARSEKEIIFTLNTSYAINTIALGFKFRPGDVVLITDKEHNSNLVPWLRLQNMGLIEVKAMPNLEDSFDLETFKNLIEHEKVRLVSMAFTSNTTGYTLPAKEIIHIAHQRGVKVLLDGAQTVPHRAVDVQDLDVDFLAFSMHKMCGPRGVGILYGKKELLGRGNHEDEAGNLLEPAILGGGTVADTTYNSYSLLDSPERFEVGIQNYPGQIASGTAIQYLQQIGMDRISAHESRLNSFLTESLMRRYGSTGLFHIIGPQDASQRGGLLTFEVKRPNAVGISEELSEKSNIMIRDGVFCAHAYFNQQFGLDWAHPKSHSEHRMVYRISLYFYNTIEECNILLETLDEIFQERSYV
jgi:cysteine desulfurase / selenocysteine lyase